MEIEDFTDNADDAMDLIGIARDRLVNEERYVGFDGDAKSDALFDDLVEVIHEIDVNPTLLVLDNRTDRLSFCRKAIVAGGMLNLLIEVSMIDPDTGEPFSQRDLVGFDGTEGEV